MVTRLWSYLSLIEAKLSLPVLIVLVLGVLYALYVVKLHLGIDIFPNGGLHLPGPRTAVRLIAHKLGL